MTTIILPSGLTGEIRGLTGKDGRYLTNEKLVRDNEVEEYILRHCWQTTVDAGPYSFGSNGIDWSQVLIGDRTAAMLHVRIETFPGEPYVVNLKCPSKVCARKFEWEIDLEQLLTQKLQPLPEASKAALRGDGRISIVIPGTSTPATFRLLTGELRKRWAQWRDQQRQGSKRQQERVNDLANAPIFWALQIEGIAHDPSARQDFLEELPFRELNALRQLVEQHDCGIDTDIEVECPACETEWTISLPFDRSFFLPTTKRAQGAQG